MNITELVSTSVYMCPARCVFFMNPRDDRVGRQMSVTFLTLDS